MTRRRRWELGSLAALLLVGGSSTAALVAWRARRHRLALQMARVLLREGRCKFEGVTAGSEEAAVRRLLDAGAPANEPILMLEPPVETMTPLMFAVTADDFGAARALLEHGADPDASIDGTPLSSMAGNDPQLYRLLTAYRKR